MPCFGKIRVMIWYTFAIIVIQVGITFQYAAFFGIIGKYIQSDVRIFGKVISSSQASRSFKAMAVLLYLTE